VDIFERFIPFLPFLITKPVLLSSGTSQGASKNYAFQNFDHLKGQQKNRIFRGFKQSLVCE
jgi:hypothetical protein